MALHGLSDQTKPGAAEDRRTIDESNDQASFMK